VNGLFRNGSCCGPALTRFRPRERQESKVVGSNHSGGGWPTKPGSPRHERCRATVFLRPPLDMRRGRSRAASALIAHGVTREIHRRTGGREGPRGREFFGFEPNGDAASLRSLRATTDVSNNQKTSRTPYSL
jgi:hypothetical protein